MNTLYKVPMYYKMLIGVVLSLSLLLISEAGFAASMGKLKAAFVAPSNKTYFFTGTEYFRCHIRTDKLEKRAKIAGNWKRVPNNLDAALINPVNKKAYFFKGSQYYRYSFKTGVEAVLPIKGNWKGIPNNIDAAVVHPSNGKYYFFKGSQYYRYNFKANETDRSAKSIAKWWKGVPNNIDAALQLNNGKVYFFKNNKYYRYNFQSDRVDKVGTVGTQGAWKELSFSTGKTSAPKEKPIRLKVTLTRIKSVQARDRDNIADFAVEQLIGYTSSNKHKIAKKKVIRVLSNYEPSEKVKRIYREYQMETYLNKSRILTSSGGSKPRQLHVKEGDESHYINNYLIFDVYPREVRDQRSEFQIRTYLLEISSMSVPELIGNIYTGFLLDKNTKNKEIARPEKDFINVNIYEVLQYLLHPNDRKYSGKKYFNSGHNGKFHAYGAVRDVMALQRGSNNSLEGTIEFGANHKETYVRFYYRFELMP